MLIWHHVLRNLSDKEVRVEEVGVFFLDFFFLLRGDLVEHSITPGSSESYRDSYKNLLTQFIIQLFISNLIH